MGLLSMIGAVIILAIIWGVYSPGETFTPDTSGVTGTTQVGGPAQIGAIQPAAIKTVVTQADDVMKKQNKIQQDMIKEQQELLKSSQ